MKIFHYFFLITLLTIGSSALSRDSRPSPKEIKQMKKHLDQLKKQMKRNQVFDEYAGEQKRVFLGVSCIRDDGVCSEFHGTESVKIAVKRMIYQIKKDNKKCKITTKPCTKTNSYKVCEQRPPISMFSFKNYIYKGFGKGMTNKQKRSKMFDLCCTGYECKQ